MLKIKTLYIYILLFVCLYIEFGYAVVVANQISGTLRSIILMIISAPLLLFTSNHSNKSILLLILSIIVIVLNILRDQAIGDNFLLLLPLLVGFLIATRIPIKICVNCFCNLMYFLTLYSLFLYSVCLIIPSLSSSLPYLSNVYDSSASIHNGIFSVVISGASVFRNYGFTWEPGAFALLLCIATFCTLHCYQVVNKKRLLVFSIAIITTFSTMGYIVLLLVFLSTLNARSTNRRKIGILLIGGILIIIAFQIPFMQELVFGKLNGLTSSANDVSETTEARINAIIYPGIAFLGHPFFGVGYEEFKFINMHLCNSVATNTIINWFAIFGLVLGWPLCYYYLYSIYKFLPSRTNILLTCLVCVGAIFLVSTESLLRISLIYVVIFWGTLCRKSKEVIDG